jgi:type-F conjugative transfer system pilin assembly protein TrbC
MLLDAAALMRRTLCVGLALTALGAGAQPAPSPPPAPPGLAAGFGAALSAEELRRAADIGGTIANDLLRAYRERAVPEMARQQTEQTRRNFDDIADPALAEERRRIKEFLGLDPDASTGLYIFVSWSMPLALLRAYAIEAMWSGASLVVKGVPPGRELSDFLLRDLRSLVYGRAAANISMDPRMFDAFGVKAVPAIVLSRVRYNFTCQGVEPVAFTYQGQELSFDACPPLPPEEFLKMSGAVSVSYALQTFVDDGNQEAAPYLRALSAGWKEGRPPGRAQMPFEGNWRDILSPEEQRAALAAAGLPPPAALPATGSIAAPPPRGR